MSLFTGVCRKSKLVAMRPWIFCSPSMANAGEDLVCGRERTEQQDQSTSFGLPGLSNRLNSCFFSLSLNKTKDRFSALRKVRVVQG